MIALSLPSLQGISVTQIFNLLTHVFIVFGMIAMFVFIWKMIKEERHKLEKVVRIVAAVTGFLIYFGARATGVSLPDMMLTSITTINKWLFGLKAIIIPAAAGTAVGWFCVKSLSRGLDIAARVVILIATFILTMFTDVYAATYEVQRAEGELAKALVPNLTFTIGLALYVIFRFAPRSAKEAEAEFRAGTAAADLPKKEDEARTTPPTVQ